MQKACYIFLGCLLVSFAGTSLKKRISDESFRYEFYTTDKNIKPESERQYYWFKGGKIHNSEYGLAGELLHDEYLKFYHSNQLAEAGTFKNGLKKGYWKTWFENGTLQSKTYWDDGQKDGPYISFDLLGNISETGKYKNNKKHGVWISYITKDTLKYRNGELIVKSKKDKDTLSEKKKKPGLLKRLFSKKQKDSLDTQNNVQKLPEPNYDNRQQQNTADTIKAKKGFFSRLFSKKTGEKS